ncbi:MAG: class I SAM-dependent methyltransferase [Lachnospiraceae bacterium]|nr:class I SAM-dependent methyltransferase [Lachnospiraceae bacterium]
MDKIWEELHSTLAWGQYPPEYLIKFMARNYYANDRSSVKVLDFGCGAGANTWYLAREGFDVYAFDGSESAIKKTGEKLAKEGLEADLKVGTGTEISYPDGFFDVVADIACIYANPIADIRVMYDKIYGFLKKGGRLVTAYFGIKTTGYKTGTEVEKDTFTGIECGCLHNRGISHFYTISGMEEMLSEAGFYDIYTDSFCYTDHGDTVDLLVTYAVK